MVKKRRRVIAAAGIIIVLAGGLMWWKGRAATPVAAQDNLTEFTVARGNVTRTVSGPGTVSPVKIFTIATNLTGDILADYFEEGDEVERDALLYQLDEDTTSLDLDMVRDTLSNAQDSYSSSLQDKSDLTTYAQQSGVVETLYVKKGEQINSGGRIADLIDASRMVITLPFNAEDAAQIKSGAAAVVYLDDYSLELNGRVQKVASGQTVSSGGALITNVEIVFDNPGALLPGGYGTAIVGEYACNNVGQTEYAGKDTIYASGSGKITSLYISAGDSVKAGQRILSVENDNVDDSVSRAAKTLADAEKKLANTQNNLQITSPIAGTVLSKSAKAGDTLYSNSTTLAVVADMSRLTFTIEVDELEIRYLEVGQTASITADAYENEIFSGVVTNVGKTGTSNNGVTTYPVTIEIEEYGGLLPGMNVNADIMVEQAENVLYVPVDAVTRGNMVLVKNLSSADSEAIGIIGGADGGFMGANAPEGYSYRRVETGISDSNYVEIVSGLNEGDIIAYRPSAAESSMNFNMMMGPGGGVMMTTGPGPGGGSVQRSTTVMR